MHLAMNNMENKEVMNIEPDIVSIHTSGEQLGLMNALRIMNDEFGKATDYKTFAEALTKASERINEMIKDINNELNVK
jgi:hypothetical protein